jgi:predicted hotdog family 3-hydroxylacyl-ACP dehydratase
MTSIEYAISDIMPHSASMLLLDRAIQGDDQQFEAEVTIRADSLFFNGSGVGSWVGLEYMAHIRINLALCHR